MIAYIFTDFSKRKNSTKRPALAQGRQTSLVLKEGTSLENPVFKLTNVNLGVNYLYLQDNNSYYFINDIISLNYSQFELVCEVDVLATWKMYIENYEGFCYRTNAFLENTGFIPDGNVQGLELFDYFKKDITFPTFAGFENGCFIIRTASLTPNRLFFMDRSGLLEFLTKAATIQLFSFAQIWAQITDIKFMPFLKTRFAAEDLKSVYLGNTEVPGFSCHYSDSLIHEGSLVTLNLNDVELGEPYNDYRDYDANWTTIELEIFNNKTSIPVEFNKKTIYAAPIYDLMTGICTFKFLNANTLEVMTSAPVMLSFKFAFNFQIAQNTASIFQVLPSETQLGIAAASGSVPGVLSGSFETLNKMMSMTSQVIGQNDNLTAIRWADKIRIFIKRRRSSDIPLNVNGAPVCTNIRIGDLPTGSYVQMQYSSIDIPSLGGEKDAVNNYMNGGFYYE